MKGILLHTLYNIKLWYVSFSLKCLPLVCVFIDIKVTQPMYQYINNFVQQQILTTTTTTTNNKQDEQEKSKNL